MLDAAIIAGYFLLILVVALRARTGHAVGVEDYFVCGRRLRWWSVAASTIATNLHAGHFLAVVGAAYAFGLAQANFELNAVVGIVLAAFVFVPLYRRLGVVTVTRFFEHRLGAGVATAYAVLMMLLYGTLYLGAALFWGGYALEVLFGPQLQVLVGGTPLLRVVVMIVLLGAISAAYTRAGGLDAVVRTDLVQFLLLLGGGVTVTVLAVHRAGGWTELRAAVPQLWHLHLPVDHPKLPWPGIGAMLLLNLQYWGCNQVILQRALAARSLRDAQVGLLVGGAFKFVTAAMLVLPGIALAALAGAGGGPVDPDRAYLRITRLLLAPGLRGLVLCGLFASLMSTVDSILNSVATLWAVDIHRRWRSPGAGDREVVAAGRRAVLVTTGLGVACGFAFAWVKLADPTFPLDPLFKQGSYFIKNSLVVLVAAAVFLRAPSRRLVLAAMLATVPLTVALNLLWPRVPYLILTEGIILGGILVVALPTLVRPGPRRPAHPLWQPAGRLPAALAWGLTALLVTAHVVFH